MMSAPTTIKATQLPSTGVEVRDRLGPLKFFVAAFLAGSILVTLTIPDGLVPVAKISRWAGLALAAVLSLNYMLRSPISRQAMAWLASGLYAAGTVIYTIDVPVTVLRSVAFLALTLGAFTGGSLLYQDLAATPHRLPDRIGIVLTLLAVPSIAGYLLGYPSWFFHQDSLFRGLFGHANTLGAFGAIWLVVGVGVFDSRLSRHRNFLLIGLIAMSLCLVASRSRAGAGGAAISILAYVLITRHLGRVTLAVVFTAAFSLSTYVILPSFTEEAARQGGDFVLKRSGDDILESRREVWQTGEENFLASPWVGYGFGTSVGEETKEWKLVNLGGREKGNAFIAILEETGILGALVMVFPIVLCVLSGLRVKRLNAYLAASPGELRNDARLAAAFWAGAMGGLANNLAEASLWSAGSVFGGMLLFLAGAAEGLVTRTEGRL